MLGVTNPAFAEDTALQNLKQTNKAFASIAKEVSPAVVSIQTDQSAADSDDGEQGEYEDIPPPFLELFRQLDPYGTPRRQPVYRQGSGFIISSDGYIVTNNHLVEKASKITVKLLNNNEYVAKIIGTDPQSDIAVIKIDAKDLPTVKLGDSDTLEVGEWVVAVGSPFGLSHSLSAGILSAKGRSTVGISDYENFLQTDAAINPGNSGGPLLDLDGKVIGINTAIFSRSGGYMGIGFAIPINMAKNVIDQLIKKGTVVRGYLGVKIQPLTQDLATSFGLKDHNGVLVAQVEPGTPAEKAGLKQGDVITSLDGKPVTNIGDFRNTVASSLPNSVHTLGVLRDNKVLELKVTVGNLNESISTNKLAKEETQSINKLGLSVQNVTEDLAAKIGVKAGVGVVISSIKPGSLADISGLSRGTIILEVNRIKVNDVAKFKSAIDAAVKSNKVLLLVQDPQYGTRYVVIKMN
jgi:serine protease Do